uniref:Zinc finger protein 512 n=1 Tax=Cyanoderma ruficeps TaxID=181631 RepID=A0A8C3RG93_9PASS
GIVEYKFSGTKKTPKQTENPRNPERWCCKRCVLTGSVEEQWSLEIQDKGRVTCPTCRAVVRKTVEGLKKHMVNCRKEMFTCHHCGKQLKSLAGMKYHVMADHNNQPVVKEGEELDEQLERERLRKVLKRMGKLKCTREVSCSFTSIMGYLYHIKKCGKAASELEKMAMKCHHCGKAYRSKAGLVYHLRSKHGPVSAPTPSPGGSENLKEMKWEQNNTGRVQRRSAKVAIYYLHELAGEELAKEWPKRKVLQDLIPDDRKLKYTRPGLPTFSQDVLCKWKTEIKMYRRVHCPNQGCESVYGSVSGLKSHLGTCTLGDFVAGKYKCLLCEKEFISESGVKYHINSVHAEVRQAEWKCLKKKKLGVWHVLLFPCSLKGCVVSLALSQGCCCCSLQLCSLSCAFSWAKIKPESSSAFPVPSAGQKSNLNPLQPFLCLQLGKNQT